MADVYPPSKLQDELGGAAERKVRDELRAQLDAKWTIFPSVAFSETSGRGARDFEIDFVLAHPEHGVICLEVKGGNVSIRDGDWMSDGRSGQFPIKDPFRQAADGMYALGRRLNAAKVGGVGAWPLSRGVVIAESTVLEDEDLGIEGKRSLVIDRSELRSAEGPLERLVAVAHGEKGPAAPGAEAVRSLREFIAPSLERRVPLAELICDEKVLIERLTADQQSVFSGIEDNPKVVVEGPAGSGKTLLAVAHAQRLAATGQSVLFVCFNKGLAAELERRLDTDGVTFTTFHSLCMRLAGEAGITLQQSPADATPDFWERELPEALMEAVDILGPRFDALVIDEAQDFTDDWFQTLTLLLKDEERSNVWLFRDGRQEIQRKGMQVPDGYARFRLTRNCRNTKAIHRKACGVVPGLEEIPVLGPPGRAPEVIKSSDQPAAVAQAISQLCREEEVLPQDIVVLSAHGVRNSRVYAELEGAYSFTTERPDPTPGKVYFSSIRGFKGLESAVVILCETEDLEPGTEDSQLYVGFTRAMNHLIVVQAA